MPRNPLLAFLACALLTLAPFASAADKAKDEETLRNANTVLQAMLDANTVPVDLLAKTKCVLVLPGVKKFGFGVGGSGGRGPLLCRTGKNGTWSAPVMYTIGGVSAGFQVGGSSTDFVLLVMSQKGIDALMNGKMKLGNEATATAGPSGATSADVGSDILTYGRAKGLFAGVSLGGATLDADTDANQRLYGKSVTASDIAVKNTVTAPEAAKPLDALLNSKTSGKK